MKRRSFLQLLGLTPAVVAVPALAKNTAIGVQLPKIDLVWYTEMEGGAWLPWPFTWETKLPTRFPDGTGGQLAMGSRGTIVAQSVKFHALRYSDGREWDTLNGWRDMEKMAYYRGNDSLEDLIVNIRPTETPFMSEGRRGVTPEDQVRKRTAELRSDMEKSMLESKWEKSWL